MHRALQILELVEMVCAQTALGSLSSLARTSTGFMNPALNALWKHQGTILHLLRCMPEDLWDIAVTQPAYVTISLRRYIILADWERFFFYSRRVRSFTIDEDSAPTTAEIYEIFNICFPEQYLLPNLKTLEWNPITPDSYHHLRLFLTPGITSFDASIRNITQLSLLPILALKCTGLTYLSIGHGAANLPDLAAKSVMSKLVCELHHLEWLVAGDLDQAAFSHLAQLPRLRHLWLMGFGRLAPPMAFQSLAGSRPFPALKSLQIETIEYAPAFFQFLSKCSLEKFTILLRGYSVPYTNETAKNCWSTLATHCSHASLQKIIFQWSSILELPTVDVDTYSIKGDILRPLFPFRSLVKLDLEHPVGFDLDDAAVLDMARAWPCIQSLSLSSHSRRIQPRVTLVGISGIAQHCPRLQRLGITFDATVIPELKPEVPFHTALYELDVAYSPIGDPFEVADYLGVIFPGLGSIRTLYEGLRDPGNMAVVAQHKAWKTVQCVLM